MNILLKHPEESEQSREFNDQFRKKTNKFSMSNKIKTLDAKTVAKIKKAIKNYDDFTDSPFDEHDFGCVKIDGIKIWWEIHYYSKPVLSICSYQEICEDRQIG